MRLFMRTILEVFGLDRTIMGCLSHTPRPAAGHEEGLASTVYLLWLPLMMALMRLASVSIGNGLVMTCMPGSS